MRHCLPVLLAQQPRQLSEQLSLLGQGMLVVLFTLLALAGFCWLVGQVFQRVQRDAASASVAGGSHAEQGLSAEAQAEEAQAEETRVLIAAAVAQAIEAPHRIAHIGQATDDAWAHEHRYQHHTSHSVHSQDKR